MLETVIPILIELCLMVNRGKCSYIVFKRKRSITVPTLLGLDGLLCDHINDDNNSSEMDRGLRFFSEAI